MGFVRRRASSELRCHGNQERSSSPGVVSEVFSGGGTLSKHLAEERADSRTATSIDSHSSNADSNSTSSIAADEKQPMNYRRLAVKGLLLS